MKEKEKKEVAVKIFEELKKLGMDAEDTYHEFKRRLRYAGIGFAEYVIIEKELEPVRGKVNLKEFKKKFDNYRQEPEGEADFTFAFVSKDFKIATVRRVVV